MTYRDKPCTESETGRRLTKLDITPEMIEAGVQAIAETNTDVANSESYKSLAELAVAIFAAMSKV